MINCVSTFTLGFVLAEVGEPVGGPTTDDGLASITAETYPNLVTAFQSGYEHDPDRQYELGLNSLLDGFEARYGASRRPARRPSRA